jgi:hypothetical protein
MRNDRIYDDQPSNPLIFVVEDDKDGRTSPANTDLVSIIEKRGQTNDRWRLCPTGGHGDSFQRASRERVRNSSEPVRDFRSRRTQSRGLITFAILLESPNYYNNNGLELSDNKPSVKQHPPTQIPLRSAYGAILVRLSKSNANCSSPCGCFSRHSSSRTGFIFRKHHLSALHLGIASRAQGDHERKM